MFIPMKKALFYWIFKALFLPAFAVGAGWCSHPELNWDQRFRKPLLYPFELWEQNGFAENTPAAANGKRNAILENHNLNRNHNPLLVRLRL
jgi:hypothetical protein